MATYRHGERDGFWDGVTAFNQSTNPRGGVGVATTNTSRPVQVGRNADNFTIYVACSAQASFVVQVAHAGNETPDDVFPDVDAQTYVWHNLYYAGTAGAGAATQLKIDIPSGGANIATLIPSWEPLWVQLLRSDSFGGTVTVTAGWEIQG